MEISPLTELNMKKNEFGFRTEKKEKFKQIFPVITDKDLRYREGEEREMIEMLGYKLGKQIRNCWVLLLICSKSRYCYCG